MNYLDHPHSFKHFYPDQLEGKTRDQLDHLALVDQCLERFIDVDPDVFEQMSCAELRDTLDLTKVERVPVAAPVKPVAAPQPKGSKRFKAQLWHDGRSVALGYFPTAALRDAAVGAARSERDQSGTLKQAARRQSVWSAPPKFKAHIWYQGKSVHLGWYVAKQVRDEVVAAAKLRRAIGLPVKMK